MTQPFALSTSNKIYFGIIAVLFSALFIVFSSQTPHQIGELIGRLVFFLLLPSLFAWIIWRLSGRNATGGSLTFNIILTLMLLGFIGQNVQGVSQLHEQAEAEFQQDLSNADNREQINAALHKLADSTGYIQVSPISTGPKKEEFDAIMVDFMTESRAVAQAWNEAYTTILSPRILDFSLLNSDEEFDYQLNTVQLYVEKTKAYSEFYANMLPTLKARLTVLGEDNNFARGAIKGATKRYHAQKTIFEPLLQTHVAYGEGMIQILELLRDNKSEWVYKNAELMSDNENLLSEYTELYEMLVNNEATINTLSEELRK